MFFFNRHGWGRALLLAATVLAVCVGASWGKDNPPMGRWVKEETKDKWGDVVGYVYMQGARVEEPTGYGGTGSWMLVLAYAGDDNLLIGIGRENNFSDRIPLPFSLLFERFDGNIAVTVSLRDENRNTKDFYGSYMRNADAPCMIQCCYDVHQNYDPEFLQWLRKNAKYTLLVSMTYMNQGNMSNWSVRGNIVGGLPYFKTKKTIEQEKREEEIRIEQEKKEKAIRIESARIKNSRQPFTDPRDGKQYLTVKIGDKTWMAENLNYETSDSWCYDDKSPNCEKYGRLYNWEAARNACPVGWYLPYDEDWDELINAAGGRELAGKKLKSSEGWDDGGNGTDDFGWSALPGGSRSGGSFRSLGSNGDWWTATELANGFGDSYYRSMNKDISIVSEDYDRNSYGFSVRCVEGEDLVRQEQERVRLEQERVRLEQERVKREVEERVKHEQLRRVEEERIRKENEVRVDRVVTSDPSFVGTVVVTSNPSGATVEIDGKRIGSTPYRFKPASWGDIAIAVTLIGYEKATKTVKFEGGALKVSFSLTPKEERNGVAGIGYGTGYGSGFDWGEEVGVPQLGGLMGGGGSGFELRRKGEQEQTERKGVVGIGYGTGYGYGSVDPEQKNDSEQEQEDSDTEQWRRFMMGILTGYSFSPKEYGLAGFYLGLIYSTRITKNVVLLNIENNFVIGKHHLDINVPLTVMLQLGFLSLETGVGEDFIWDTDYGGTMFRTGLVVGAGVGRKDYRIFYRFRDVDKHPAHWVGIWLLF